MKKIVVVSSSWCSQCSVLKDALDRNNVQYVVVDADEDMDYCREQGVRSLPTTILGDEQKLIGSSPDVLKKIVGFYFQ